MSPAFAKTFYLILIIAIGYLMKKKVASKDQKDGIKSIILSLALPATIFIALLKIDFVPELALVPVLALAFNFIVFALLDKIPLQKTLGVPANQYRALTLLIPSLAPGLSCFPFIMEYSGGDTLAMAALADVGNKVFVLVIAYTIAMRWYFSVNGVQSGNRKTRIKGLVISLIEEPVNMVIAVALIMLALGLNFESLPSFAQMSIDKISLMMTPLVLLFIGISVKLTLEQVRTIFTFLFVRSGIAFLLSGLLLAILPVTDLGTALLIVVFPQSACSFWPFAHMSAVSKLEKKNHVENKTFDLDFAMNVIACSLPFSVILILGVYSSGSFFSTPAPVAIAGLILLALAVVPAVVFAKRPARLVLEEKAK